jgi:hypothetical protein
VLRRGFEQLAHQWRVAGRRYGRSLSDLATGERCHFLTPSLASPPKAPESRKLLKECVSPLRRRTRRRLPGSIRTTASRHRAQPSPNPPEADGPGSRSKRTTGSAGGTRVTPARDSFARVSPPSLISWNPTVAGIRSAAAAFNRSVQAYAWRPRPHRHHGQQPHWR